MQVMLGLLFDADMSSSRDRDRGDRDRDRGGDRDDDRYGSSRRSSNDRRIYVGNLPASVKVRDLEDVFHSFGKLVFIDLKSKYSVSSINFNCEYSE
jgi:hypothetical protein